MTQTVQIRLLQSYPGNRQDDRIFNGKVVAQIVRIGPQRTAKTHIPGRRVASLQGLLKAFADNMCVGFFTDMICGERAQDLLDLVLRQTTPP